MKKNVISALAVLAAAFCMTLFCAQAAGTNTVTATAVPSEGGTAALAHAPNTYGTETTITTEDGEQVNVIDKPNPGFQVKEIYVAGDGYNCALENGKKYFYTNGTGKQYQVRVTFEKIEYSVHMEPIPPSSHLPGQAISAQYDSVISYPKTATVGDPVRLKVAAPEGYEVESVQWQGPGANDWRTVTTYDGSGTSFVMPAGDAFFRVDVKEAPPRITTVSLPDATAGEHYHAMVEAAGGYQMLYDWSVVYDNAPDWMKVDPTGYKNDFMSIYGTPTEPGTYTVVAQVKNFSGLTDTKTFTLTVKPAVNSVSLDYTVPTAGKKADPSVTCEGAAVASAAWYQQVMAERGIPEWTPLSAGSTFKAGKNYMIRIQLEPPEGKVFAAEKNMEVSLNGVRESEVIKEWTNSSMTVAKEYTAAEEVLENPFVDVFESDPYYDAVLWAYYAEPQITNGMDATHFGPRLTVTRGQCVAFLWRAMGCPEPVSAANPFVDVPASQYYYKPVLWAVEKGITKGVDATHFNPDDTLSTQHIVTFLYRTLNPGKDGWDGPAAAWAGSFDTTGHYYPFGVNIPVNNETPCPRANVVQFLYAAVK